MKLTVLLPVHNTPPAYLLESVASIMAQDISEKPLVWLLDDGTTDPQTLAAINLCERMWGVTVIRNATNQGLATTLNQGIMLAQTEYIARMDADDIAHHTRLRLQCDYLETYPEVDVLGTQLFGFWADDIYRAPIFHSSHQPVVPPNAMHTGSSWVLSHSTVVYRKSAVIGAGGYDPAFRRAQDIDLWKRMLAQDYVLHNLPQVLVAWRRYRWGVKL